MAAWVGQYCIYVSDLERAVKFYEALGLQNTSRTDLDTIKEAIVENPDKGGKLQLAQKLDQDGPIDMGNAFWKLYVATNDIDKMFADVVALGAEVVMEPARLDQWPMSIGFVKDPDGYLVELTQRHPVDGRRRPHARVAQPVLHLRQRSGAHDRVLRTARAGVHEPHRHPRAQGSDPREHRARAARSSSPSSSTTTRRSRWAARCGSCT